MIATTLAAVILASTFAGHETPVSPLRSGLNAHRSMQHQPRITPGDGAFLVTWADYRTVVPQPAGLSVSGPFSGAAIRIGTDGTLLDEAAFRLPLIPRGVVWNGRHWIVFDANGFARISRDGVVLDREPQRFPSPLPVQGDTILAAWTGTAIVAAATGPIQPSGDGHFMGFTFDGEMRLFESHVLFDRATSGGRPLGIAVEAGKVMVVFRGTVPRGAPSTIHAAFFDEYGTLLTTKVVHQQPEGFDDVAAGAAGGQFAIVARTRTPGAIFVAELIDAETLAQVTSRTFGVPSPQAHLFNARELVRDGDSLTFLDVVRRGASNDQELYATVLDPASQSVGPSRVVMPWPRVLAYEAIPVAAEHDGSWLLVEPRRNPAPLEGDRFVARTAPDVMALSQAAERDLIVGAFPQETMAVAAAGTQSLVVWREQVRFGYPLNPLFDVFAARVSDGGTILDPQSIRLNTGSANACWRFQPAVFAQGRDFFVAWVDPNGMKIRLVRENGTLGSPYPSGPPMDCNYTVTMKLAGASNGNGGLLVWTERRDGTVYIHGQRIDKVGGALHQQPLAIGTTADADAIPSIASDGQDYLVTFSDQAVRVSAGGTVTPAVATFGAGARAEGVFWNGTSYIAWVRFPDDNRLARIARDGSTFEVRAPIAGAPVLNIAAKRFSCSGGACYAPHGERLARVNADFTVTMLPIDIAGRLFTEVGGATRPLLAYVRLDDSPEVGGVPRVFIRATTTLRGKPRAVRH